MGNWTNYASWPYRKKLTLQKAYISGSGVNRTLTNFPFLWRSGYDSNISGNAASKAINWRDLVFTSSDGETRVNHEVDFWRGGSGAVWIKAPTLTHNTDADFYVYYGEGTDHSNDANYKPSGVWDKNYVFVAHCSANTKNYLKNSTLYNISALKVYTTTVPTPIYSSAKIGHGYKVDENRYFRISGSQRNMMAASNFSYESFIKYSPKMGTYGSWFGALISFADTDTGESPSIYRLFGSNAGIKRPLIIMSGGASGYNYKYYNETTLGRPSSTYWEYVAAGVPGNQASSATWSFFYANNRKGTILEGPAAVKPTTKNKNKIALFGTQASFYRFSGSIDEVRFTSGSQRTRGWYLTSYYSMSSTTKFIVKGIQEDYEGEAPPVGPSVGVTSFDTMSGTATGWKWDNAGINSTTTPRSFAANALTLWWGTITGSVNIYIPSGGPTKWGWCLEYK